MLDGIEKHCTEDLREQADRSTASLVAVQAPCDTMTPVAPGLQLSSEANAIVAGTDGDAGGTNDEFEI